MVHRFFSCLSLVPLFLFPVLSQSQTPLSSRELWAQYARDPDRHPNIPNCSFAGYRSGEEPKPVAGFELSLSAFGALPDTDSDSTNAFRNALAELSRREGGILLLEAGRYRIDSWLRIDHSNIVLRGHGAGLTFLDFSKPLDTAYARNPDDRGTSQWGWCGGLLWIGPPSTFDPSGGLVHPPTGSSASEWESWRGGPELARVTADGKRGDRQLSVDTTGKLRPGQWVLFVEENPSDASLLREAYGHEPSAKCIPGKECGDCSWILPPKLNRFLWPVRISEIEGDSVFLEQPLRLSARVAWQARLQQLDDVVHGVGIEGVTIVGHARPAHKHLEGDGWNGVYLNRAIDCWVRDVEGVDLENGVVLASAKQCTIGGVRLAGTSAIHHPFACRVMSCDNLFEDFVIQGPPVVMHGINVEFLSSGNVWRRGRMERGTFDTHRALPFDAIYTDIEVANDTGAWLGGANQAGPQMGRSVVRWNVRIVDQDTPERKLRGGAIINQPRLLPLGALVGVRGAVPDFSDPKAMPPGDKGTIMADVGAESEIPDLYAAQRSRRLSAGAR